MCRNCPLPQWSEPVEVEVSSLPAYFVKEQSWNFERLNFGNGTVLDTANGKPARPSVTGVVGTRLRDGFALKPHPRFPGGRYLLVSECLYCPGRRYGCTPRENCTGKRRFCSALCKISIFADKPNIAFIYYSGSHGAGDVSAVDKHRPNKQMLDELRRLRVEEGLTPSQGFEWCKTYFTEHGLDEKQMPTKQQIKSLMKRASKVSRMRETKGGIKRLTQSNSPAANSASTQAQPTGENINVAFMKFGQFSYPENGEIGSEASSSTYLGVSQDGSTISASAAGFTPGSTPVGAGTLSRMSGTSLLNSPISLPTSVNNSESKQGLGEKGNFGFLASPRSLTDMERDKDADKLKEHIRILQEENFNRISQIADLQVEVNNLKNQVLELKEDNLKKAIHIAQLERERRAGQCLTNEESTENAEESQRRSVETISDNLVENNEQPLVIENTEATPMVTDPVESTQPVQSSVYQEGVCETPIAVSLQATSATTRLPEEANAVTQNVPAALQNPVVVAQAIIVSQAAVEDRLS